MAAAVAAVVEAVAMMKTNHESTAQMKLKSMAFTKIMKKEMPVSILNYLNASIAKSKQLHLDQIAASTMDLLS